MNLNLKFRLGLLRLPLQDTGEYLTHDLDLDEWGISKAWVIIKKD